MEKVSVNYVRYSTIIHNTDGVGVWFNTFANALIIKYLSGYFNAFTIIS